MKQLLYYNLNDEFVNEQTNMGGDGTKVVSTFNGVAWANDTMKTYYRYGNKPEDYDHYTVFVVHMYRDPLVKIASEEVYLWTDMVDVKAYKGCKNKITIYPKEFSGYSIPYELWDFRTSTPKGIELTVSSDTIYTFYYDKVVPDNVVRVYYYKDSTGKTKINSVTNEFPYDETYVDGVLANDIYEGNKPIYSAYTFSGALNSVHRVDYVLKTGVTSLYTRENVPIDSYYSYKWLTGGVDNYISPIKKVVLPKNITKLQYDFREFQNLEEIIIYGAVTSITYGCFSKCPKLEVIVLPEGLTNIGTNTVSVNGCFNGCTSLKTLVLPSTLTMLHERDFSPSDVYHASACTSLTEIYCHAITPPTCYGNSLNEVFSGIADNGTLYYPDGSDYSEWLKGNISQLALHNWKGDKLITGKTIDYSKQTNKHNGYEFIDLGLSSRTLFATMDLGASSPEEIGDRFAWAETEPKETYTWDNYKYGTENNITKYNATDGLTELEPDDDAAHVIMGGKWKIGTYGIHDGGLSSQTTRTIESVNGKDALVCVSKMNGQKIVFPLGYSTSTYSYLGSKVNENDGTYRYTWSYALGSDGSSSNGRCNRETGGFIRGIIKIGE